MEASSVETQMSSRSHPPRPPCWQDFHQSTAASTAVSLRLQQSASKHRHSGRPCLCVRRTLSDNDREVDHETVDSTAPLYGHPRRSLAGKNRLHRTRVGIELDRLPDHVTAHTGNASRKRRSTSAGSEYEVKSSAEIMRRCEQWLNDVRRATSTSGLTAGHIASVTTSGCEQAAVDIDTY